MANKVIKLNDNLHWAPEAIIDSSDFNGKQTTRDHSKEVMSSKLKPVLLWANPSQTSSMSSGAAINLSDSIENYNWLIFCWRYTSSTDDPERRFRIVRTKPLLDGTFTSVPLDTHYMTNANSGVRLLTYTNTTRFTAGAGYWNAKSNNANEIPVAIWGLV